MWAQVFFLVFVTMHAFDRRTDRQTEGQKDLRSTVRALHAVAR